MKLQVGYPLALLLGGALSMGCAKMLAFGTATTFGLDASQRADQSVEVTIGYRRLEVASIPAGQKGEAHGTHTDDAYSVIGSFGVRYPGFGDPLILNQVFATGVAAEMVAKDQKMQEFFGEMAAKVICLKSGCPE